ncbi:cyclopropane-fatty-acyl-phospholipid synthase family protein [Nocardioides sp.]|uniref:cyclopropane-fatty-acyl-phospholipid synthase family protein n=1 Tax=Nocardioides sp. TaxID=35761 RepID=UPI002B26C6C7|nr:cyclopropane-fatty-acyl-phospholipid synthase family protein [Nocardioides sp.]
MSTATRTTTRSTLKIGDVVADLMLDGMAVRFTAYDGSSAGPEDAEIRLELTSQRGLQYLVTAPGDLGLARAYVAGDLLVHGAHPGNPYEAMQKIKDHTKFRTPSAAELVTIVRGLGLSNLKPPPPPPQEHLPRWRRVMEGLRHSMVRDAEAIHHHYDVSNAFYEMVLGPSMAYTCAVYPHEGATLEEAQFEKFDLVARKLGLEPGMRLLDVGCGWGGMARHAAKEYGVQVLGVTLSQEQASYAREMLDREGLADLAEVRHLDYRHVPEGDFDAVSSIGLTEHIGIRNYPSYFSFLHDKLKPGGRLLNHCITRHHNRLEQTGAFIDRYVFPDGELTGSGTIIAAAENAGFEVMHSENLRVHYARTLAHWNDNLVANWDAAVEEVGIGTARVWGLYMAACRVGFERNEVQLVQVLGAKVDADGHDGFPLRPSW